MKYQILLSFFSLFVAVWSAASPSRTSATELTPLADMVLDPEALLMPANATYGRAINGVSFQTEALLTVGRYQYATWYHQGNFNEDVYVGRRDLTGTTWEVLDTGDNMTNGDSPSWDAHNVISLGIAGDGSMHLVWDLHGHTLRYVDTAPGAATAGSWNGSLFSSERSSLNVGGGSVSAVTYPRFVTDSATGDMMLTYRTGGSGAGNINFATRDNSTGLWDAPHEIINGTNTTFFYDDPYGGGSNNRNAYLNGIDVDSTGRLHTTWTWRESATGSSNHDIAYAYSDDGGDTWRNNEGTVVGTVGSPIDYGSPGIHVVPMDRGNTLMNQQTQAVDQDGRVHAIMWHKTDEAPPVTGFTTAPAAYFHYMRDPTTGVWSRNDLPTERAVGSRPDMAYDDHGNVYAAYLSPGENDPGGYYTSGDLIIAAASKATGYADWQIVSTDTRGFAGEPFIDQRRLLDSGVVSVVIQENAPNEPGATGTPLRVIEYDKLANLVVWAGDDAGDWTVGGGTEWDNDNDNVGDTQFANGFRATFDDDAATFSVNVTAPVAPVATEFRNTALNSYSLTGQGVSGAGGLKVTGGGTVNLNNGANDYAGNTEIVSGTLNLLGDAALSATPNIHVRAGGTLSATGTTTGNLTLSNQHLAIEGAVQGNVVATGGASIALDAANGVVGNVTLQPNSTLTGAGGMTGNLTAGGGGVVQIGGAGLPASTQQQVTILDDFSGNLAAYDSTVILDVNGGASNGAAWQTTGGALQLATTSYDDIEQYAMIRSGVSLQVGEEIQVDLNHNGASQDLGLYVGGTAPVDGVRADYVSIYGRGGSQVYSRGFDGTSEFSLVSGNFPGYDSLFIARTATNTYEAGVYDGATRLVLVSRTPGSPNDGDVVGFYADVRNLGVLGALDNFRLLAEGSAYAGETLAVDGDVTLTVGATVMFDVAESGVGDKLAVGGALVAGGTLHVTREGALPALALGDQYDLFDFAAASGAFDNYVLPSLDPGLVWNVTQLTETGALQVVVDVDVNDDGWVNGGDFLAIQRTDPGLIAEWQAQFGNRVDAGASPALAAVPEPGAAVLAAVAGLALGWGPARRFVK